MKLHRRHACLLLLSLPAAGAGADEHAALRIAWSDYPPFQWRGENGQPQGLDVELLELIAQEAGERLVWSRRPWARQVPDIGQGELDLMGSATPSPERQALGEFTQPYRNERVALIALGADAAPVRRLADLKGRRIALQKGSSAHYLVLRAVEKAGLAWSDITPVYLAPADARAAFERGSVDAWGIWDPYYAVAEIDGRARVLSTGVGLSSNNSFYLASRELTRRPAQIQALLAALSEADAWTQDHLKETAQFLSAATGVPLAGTVRFLDRRRHGLVRPLGPGDVADQQRVADTFSRQGLIPRPVDVVQAVWLAGHAVAGR